MLKRMVSTFVFYVQEMMTLLFILSLFLSVYDEPLSLQRTLDHVYWFLTVYLILLIPYVIVSKKKQNKMLMYIPVPILLLLGWKVWAFQFASLILLTLLPFWRGVELLHLQHRTEYLHQRFWHFGLSVLIGYSAVRVLSDVDPISFTIYYMWLQVVIFITALFLFHYIKQREETGTTFFSWLKNLSLFSQLMIGVGLVGGLLYFTFAPVRSFVVAIPKVIYAILTLEVWAYLLSWMDDYLGWLGESLPEETEQEPMEEGTLVQDMLEQEPSVSPWFSDFIAIVLAILVVAFVLFVAYIIVRNFYMNITLPSPKADGKRFEVDSVQGKPKQLKRKSIRWAKDEWRRMYQSLLIHSIKKGEPFYQGKTAFEWPAIYQTDLESKERWQRINTAYDKIRYSGTSLTAEEWKEFKKDVQLAKKEMNRYHREKNRLEKGKAKGKGGERWSLTSFNLFKKTKGS